MTTGVDKGSILTPSALTSTDTEDGQATERENGMFTHTPKRKRKGKKKRRELDATL